MRVFIAGGWRVLCPEFGNFEWISYKIDKKAGSGRSKGNMESWSCICFLGYLAFLLRHKIGWEWGILIVVLK